jgi:uncharacterized small protein (DUF1192 family)
MTTKNLFPGGSYVTLSPSAHHHQVLSGPQRYNMEKRCWEYDHGYSQARVQTSSGITFQNIPGSTQPDFSKVTIYNAPWPDDPPMNQITQQQFTPENMNKYLNWSIQEKDKEIAELKKEIERLKHIEAHLSLSLQQCESEPQAEPTSGREISQKLMLEQINYLAEKVDDLEDRAQDQEDKTDSINRRLRCLCSDED